MAYFLILSYCYIVDIYADFSHFFFFFFLHSLDPTLQWPEAQNPSNWQGILTRRARYFSSCKGIQPIPVVRSHDFFFSFAGFKTQLRGWRRGACNSYNPFMRCTPSKRSTHALRSAAHTRTYSSATVKTDSTFFFFFQLGAKKRKFSALFCFEISHRNRRYFMVYFQEVANQLRTYVKRYILQLVAIERHLGFKNSHYRSKANSTSKFQTNKRGMRSTSMKKKINEFIRASRTGISKNLTVFLTKI